jgi:hypothetical protein
VRRPGKDQFKGQQIANSANPTRICNGHTGARFATVVPFINSKMEFLSRNPQ